MKVKDSLALARMRLNNKSTHLTILSLILGCLMLIPVVWIIFSFYIGFGNEFNNMPINNILLVEHNVEEKLDIRNEGSAEFVYNNGGRQLTTMQYSSLDCNETLMRREFFINCNNALESLVVMKVNDSYSTVSQQDIKMKFITNGAQKSVLTTYEDFLISMTGIGAILDNKFTENVHELYLSERFLRANNLEQSSVLGGRIYLLA